MNRVRFGSRCPLYVSVGISRRIDSSSSEIFRFQYFLVRVRVSTQLRTCSSKFLVLHIPQKKRKCCKCTLLVHTRPCTGMQRIICHRRNYRCATSPRAKRSIVIRASMNSGDTEFNLFFFFVSLRSLSMTAGISRVFARFQGILIFTSLQFFLSSTRHFLQQRETEMEQEILHVAATGNNKIPRNETNNETCKTC